jgi:hypothetical protein
VSHGRGDDVRQTRALVLAFGVMVVSTVALSGCGVLPVSSPTASPAKTTAPGSEFGFGQMVAAKWTDGNLWLAKVLSVDGTTVTVQYADDNTTRTVPTSDVKPIPTRQWAVGDKVLAVWSSGRFYKGVITKAGASSYQVKWDDGSAPTDVPADKIIAQ